jgi:hypothetical protein
MSPTALLTAKTKKKKKHLHAKFYGLQSSDARYTEL